jgi:hypothetical protein
MNRTDVDEVLAGLVRHLLAEHDALSLHGISQRWAGGEVTRLGERVPRLQRVLLELIADGEVEAFRGERTGRLMFKLDPRRG